MYICIYVYRNQHKKQRHRKRAQRIVWIANKTTIQRNGCATLKSKNTKLKTKNQKLMKTGHRKNFVGQSTYAYLCGSVCMHTYERWVSVCLEWMRGICAWGEVQSFGAYTVTNMHTHTHRHIHIYTRNT